MSSAEVSHGRRALTKTQNRQTILAAARQVFADMGYGAATVRDIIRATPLAAGTFYNYFKSKDEVYLALRDEAALAVRPHLQDGRAEAATVEEFLSRSFGAFFAFVHDHRADFGAAVGGAGFRTETPSMLALLEDLRLDLEIAVARGLFPEGDVDYLAASIMGVAFEIAARMVKRERADPEAAASFATALFLGGIGSLPKKS